MNNATEERVSVQIENCNNIESGVIDIVKNQLNIKFAANGTGKSTIANAINYRKTENLAKLTPFGSVHKPSINLDKEFNTISIFNEDFVKSIVFEKDTVIKDAFSVFVKTSKYDQLNEKLENRLAGLHKVLKDDEAITAMSRTFSFVKAKLVLTKEKMPKNNPFFKSLSQNSNQYRIPQPLNKFRPFISSESYNADWVDWKDTGFKFDDHNICPFCTAEFADDYQQEKETFKQSYKKNDIKNVKDMRGAIEDLREYLSEDRYEKLIQLIMHPTDIKALEQEISQFVSATEYLNQRIQEALEFGSNRIQSEEISNLNLILKELIIGTDSGLEYFHSDKTLTVIGNINEKINHLMKEVAELKKELGELNGLVLHSASSSQRDINEFLDLAGFDYEISINVNEDKSIDCKLLYKHREKSLIPISDIRDHLSWGERNAFALILFMFDAISKNADFIILDDPISSFDNNKKYAIISRLFNWKKTQQSFAKKTVVLLTHDFEPLIDFLIVGKPYREATNATFLKNIGGRLTEQVITYEDFTPCVKFYSKLAGDSKLPLMVRISSLRKYLEYTEQNLEENLAYSMLSSAIHGKMTAEKKLDKSTYILLEPEEQTEAIRYIAEYINDFDYGKSIETIQDKSIFFESYGSEKRSYIKLLLLRGYISSFACRSDFDDGCFLKMIDEQYHIENDYSHYLDYLKFDIIPVGVIEKSDSYIDSQKVIFLQQTMADKG